MKEDGEYLSIYKGTVLNNIDPERRGRLILNIPAVLNMIPSTWAEPCLPLAGPTGPPMGVFMVPPIQAGVWVKFEHGDPNYPIWVGCRWGGTSDVPLAAQTGPPISPNIVIQTAGQNTVVISDTPGPTGGITIKTLTNVSITVNETGIYIQNNIASIKMFGPVINIDAPTINISATVAINIKSKMVAINGSALQIIGP